MTEKVDYETQKILNEQNSIRALVENEGWKYAREILSKKILDLQNAFNMDDSNAADLLVDLRSRKLATTILFDFLRELEGTAAQAVDNKPLDKSYLVKLE